jgi:hypothetical protein
MTTTAFRLASLAALVLVFAAADPTAHSTAGPPPEVDGDAASGLVNSPPNHAVQAAFTQRSYAPDGTATLHLLGGANGLQVSIYRAGAGHDGPLQGSPVDLSQTLHGSTRDVALTLGAWPSGLYYARVTTPGRGAWYAPFVLRPQRLGMHRVLVVLPTNTWQAYNFEHGDSWYLNPEIRTVDLARPYIDGGVPPHYRGYDRGFLRWLAIHHEAADVVSDDDLDQIASAGDLARAYDLIVFPGHEEYVTAHEYDLIQRYRDLGGNLAFLSANDFFYKVVKQGNLMKGRWRWRDLGRPEAALVGAQYVDWNHGRYRNRPFTVTGTEQAPWLFRQTGLRNGGSLGVYGIEIDALTNSSPPDTRVLARIPDIFGPGKSAEMTYYTTSRGAKVFAAGVMNFGGSALWPVVSTMMENIWTQLSHA